VLKQLLHSCVSGLTTQEVELSGKINTIYRVKFYNSCVPQAAQNFDSVTHLTIHALLVNYIEYLRVTYKFGICK